LTSNSDLSAEEIAFQVTALQNTRKQFQSLLNKSDANHFNQDPHFCMNQRAVLAALFIKLYRDQPILHLPYKLLTNLIEIDELWTTWRQRHAIMVQRMLGTRIGTGGSAGADYLKKTTEKNRVFSDLFHLSSYMIPRSELPELPESISRQLGFYFTPQN
jgi:tryptophan 2,3-dioxygenase